MRICHLTTVHTSKDTRIFYKMCVSLAQLPGAEVFLVAPGQSRREKGVQVVGLGPAPAGRGRRMTTWAKHGYQTAKALDADIYHLHDPELLPWGWALQRQGKQVIFDSHEFYSLQIQEKTWLPAGLRRPLAWLYRRVETVVCRRLAAVITVCTLDGKNDFQGRCRRHTTVSNAPRLEAFPDSKNVKKNERSAAYVGSLSASRGVPAAVAAVHQAGGRLYLAGRFSPPALQRELARLPEWESVEYLGFLGREEVAQLLAQSEVGLAVLEDSGQYHRIDTFPVKVYEYMAAGIPCVVHSTPYIRKELARHEFGIALPEGDPAAYGAALRVLFDHPEKARAMGRAGRRAAEEEFNWNVEEKKLFALYRALEKEITP